MSIEELDRMPKRVRERYLEMVRRIPPGRKFRQAFEYTDLIRGIMVAGIRAQHPDISDDGIREEMRKRILPPDLRRKAYG
jgi:hypothetical protein